MLCDATVAVGAPLLVNISHKIGHQSEGTIAIDPADPSRLFAASNESAVSLFGATSGDAGATWAARDLANGADLPQACCDPSVAWDEFGNLFLAYLAVDTGAAELAVSEDGGQSFAPVATFPGDNDQPTVAAGAGSVWVAFNQENTHAVVYGAAVTGAGQVGRFRRTRQISPRAAPGAPPPPRNVADVAVGPGGQVLLTYQTAEDEGPSTIYAVLDPDGLGRRPFGAPVAVTGTNVGDFDHVPPQSQRTIDAEADLAYDASGGPFGGRVYLGYTDETPDESGDTDVYVRYSDDDGATWSAAIRLNDDSTNNGQILPRVAVDPATGAFAATWHDARYDSGTGGAAGPDPVTPGVGGTDAFVNNETQFYGVVGLPAATGLALLPNFEINGGFSRASATNNPNEYGDYTGLDFRWGELRPAWADNSNATGDNPEGFHSAFDLYTALVPVTVTDPAPPPARLLVGQVGDIGRASLEVIDLDGTVATFSMRGGGSARLFQQADRIDVELVNTTRRSALRVVARGGADGRVKLGDVTAAAGPMASVDAPAADLLGTLSIAGPLARVTLADVSGGTIAAGGAIGRVSVDALSGAHVLSGALPATPTRAATFGPGSIARLTVRGGVTSSVVGAGLDPVNGQFLDADDRVIGGASSIIRSVLVKGGVDEATRFVAGAFRTARVPERVDPSSDPRFVVEAP